MKKLVSSLLLLVFGIGAQAQTPFSYDVLAQLVFPQAIIFEASVALPAEEVARVVLTIAPANGVSTVIEMPRDVAFEFAQEYVVANYRWQVPVNAPPPLASEVAYTWQIVTTRDEVVTAEGVVIYQDERVPEWQTVANDAQTLSVTAPKGIASLDVVRLYDALNTVYTRLETETNTRPVLKWLLYTDALPLGCARDADGQAFVTYTFKAETMTEPCNAALIERVFAGYTIETFTSESVWLDAKMNEMVRAFYAPFWQGAALPSWVIYAVTQLYKPYPSYDQPAALRQTLRTQRPLSLSQLAELPTDPQRLALWEAQAESLLRYLMDKWGVPATLELVRGLATTPIEEAFTRLSGAQSDALLPAWQAWLYTARAEQAYGYSLYQPVTATPTATFTPSRTPRPSALPPTPTATDDATPTLRPTHTGIPPTATVTPLPAGGFTLRSTPVPVVAPVSTAPSGYNALWIGGVIMALLALLGIGVWVWRRRRTR